MEYSNTADIEYCSTATDTWSTVIQMIVKGSTIVTSSAHAADKHRVQ